MNVKINVLITLLIVMFFSACSDTTLDNENNKSEIHVALSAQPETIDPMMTTGAPTKYVARHIYESLVALDQEHQPVPMLAESIDVSNNGKTYTFYLREGIQFHNGKEMNAEDVVASMNRWLELAASAKDVLGEEAYFKELDKFTVVLEMKQPSLGTLDVIATHKQFPGIMPKEIIEDAGNDGVKEIIGTGPFKFVEWKQDQYVHLNKFENYKPVNLPPDGLSGKKEVFITDLYFDIVTDSSTRLAGLQTGEYDVALELNYDSYNQIKNDPNLKTYPFSVGQSVLIYNKKEGLFTNVKMRQAINAAINAEEIMKASFINEDLYEINAGYMNSDQKDWFTEVGKEAYNQNNPEKAKNLLKEAGYKGEEIRLLTTRDSEYLYKGAIVLTEQLEKLGLNIKIEDYDWTTYQDRRTGPLLWDLLMMGLTTVSTPSQLLSLSSNWSGWTEDEKITELLNQIDRSNSIEEAQETWNELQKYSWTEYVPITKFGGFMEIVATNNKIDGFTTFNGPILWNTKISD